MPLLQAKALLFDMDGTLIDTSAVIERLWRTWAESYGVDTDVLLRQAHGRRAIDTIQRFGPSGIDHNAEAKNLNHLASLETNGIVAIPGAQTFLEQLAPHEWAIVTSAQREIAKAWLSVAGLPKPEIMICAEDVCTSKPDPEGYLLAAKLLKCAPENAVVFEDSEAGLIAARAAGSKVIGIGVSHHLSYLADDWFPDFRAAIVKRRPDGCLTLLS